MSEFSRIAVAVDGSDGSIRAARVASRLSRDTGSRLTLLHVYPILPSEIMGAVSLTAEEIERAKKSSAERVFKVVEDELSDLPDDVERTSLLGDPAEEILGYLEEHSGTLMVMGRRGRSKIQSLLLGSVSDKVVRHARSPVTLVT